MILNWLKKRQGAEVPGELYEKIVVQARQPAFFTRYGFADTVTGRFDCLALHMFLFTRRLVREDDKLTNALNQEVFDRFTDDTDRALRELGVGDTSVPKRKKKLVRGYYAMIEGFSGPLDEDDHAALGEQLAYRFRPPSERSAEETDIDIEALTAYVAEAAAMLDQQRAEAILAGTLNWPDEEAVHVAALQHD